jgi:hypothetical protein
VIAECLRAKRHGKPTLVFLKSLPGRRPEVDDLLADLNKKDATFSGINELKSAVRDTLHSTCVGGIRKLSEKRPDPIIHSESAGYLLNRPPDTRQLLMFLVFDMTIENQGVAATVLKSKFGRNPESRSREAAGRRNWPEAVPRKRSGRKRAAYPDQ